MQFLINVLDDTTNSGTSDEMAAIDVFNDRLVADGHWVLAGGLSAPNASAVIDGRGGAGIVSDGPFTELAEYVSGFWVIEAAGRDEAIALATEGSKACNRRVEVRALL